MPTSVTSSSRVVGSALWSVAPLTGLAAAGLNAGLFFAADSAGLFPATALINGAPLSVLPVIISSIIPTIVAAGVFALLGRFTQHPVRIFTILAIVLTILSFANPFLGIPGVTVPMAVVLNLMHVVVAGCVVYSFRRNATA
jgi:hypothetical protein